MDRLNRLVIDSTGVVSDMCWFTTEFGTDKSPYFYKDDPNSHRHAYSAVYDLIFANLRFQPIIFGELGILDNSSMHAWRSYFPNATLYGFEYFAERIDAARTHALPRTHYVPADIGDTRLFFEAVNSTEQTFDVLIDDSTHLFEHQINFINVAVDFVKPGGMVIVEDIFRDWPEQRFTDALRPILQYFSSGTFIETNHEQRYSEGTQEPWYNNDKLLVLHRNQVARPLYHPHRDRNLMQLRQQTGSVR
jgi:hypothetical protein